MNRRKILIVDDDELVRELLYQELSDKGYQCQKASSAAQALDELESNPVELVILDINMPGKSGIELLPELRVRYPDTMVIMVTAIADTCTAIQCMREGACDYITKPFNLDEVVLRVGRALEKKRLNERENTYRRRRAAHQTTGK